MKIDLGAVISYCPYCRVRERKEGKLQIWTARSVTHGLATRWTRCEICSAMWREVYNWQTHSYEYAEHWKPRD